MMSNPFGVPIIFLDLLYTQGFTLGLNVEPLWGSFRTPKGSYISAPGLTRGLHRPSPKHPRTPTGYNIIFSGRDVEPLQGSFVYLDIWYPRGFSPGLHIEPLWGSFRTPKGSYISAPGLTQGLYRPYPGFRPRRLFRPDTKMPRFVPKHVPGHFHA